MAEVNFGAGQKPVLTPTPAATPEAAKAAPVEVVGATVPAVIPAASVPATASAGGMLGDHIPDFSEIVIPRVNLVQGMGVLKDSFEVGSLVFGRQLVLFTPPRVVNGVVQRQATPPINVTVLGFRPTRYVQKTGSGERGIIVSTEAEVRNAGGTLDYKEWEAKKASGLLRFEPLADALVLIERPADVADDDTVFVYPIDGKKYALALWAMRGVQYTAAAKKVFFTQRRLGCLRGGYPTMNFSVSTRLESWQGGKSAWIPICVPAKKSTPEMIGVIREILTGSVTPQSAPEGAADDSGE